MSMSLSGSHAAQSLPQGKGTPPPQSPTSSSRLRRLDDRMKEAKSLAALIRGLADPDETPELERALQAALDDKEQRFLEQTLRRVFEYHRRPVAGELRSATRR